MGAKDHAENLTDLLPQCVTPPNLILSMLE